jgi:hypothetical protein
MGGIADVVSAKAPRGRASTCGTSLRADLTGSWGVCAND